MRDFASNIWTRSGRVLTAKGWLATGMLTAQRLERGHLVAINDVVIDCPYGPGKSRTNTGPGLWVNDDGEPERLAAAVMCYLGVESELAWELRFVFSNRWIRTLLTDDWYNAPLADVHAWLLEACEALAEFITREASTR